MAITRFDPFFSFPRRTRGVVNRLFRDFLSDELEETVAGRPWCPCVDVKEKNNEYVLEFELPGVDKKNVSLAIDNNVLTVSGEKKTEEKKEEENYYYSERSYGRFERSFTLPEDVKSDKIDANFKNGVLTVSLPKTEKPEPKKIEIK